MYKVPDEYYFRIHHVRPRFKDDVENVLFHTDNVSKLFIKYSYLLLFLFQT